MPPQLWTAGATPHRSIREGSVDDALFEAKLVDAMAGTGPDEYTDPARFWQKTSLTYGLTELLLDVLFTLKGQRRKSPIINLKTSFGGGKTHTLLAIYHLLVHAQKSMTVDKVKNLVQETVGLAEPPDCHVAVLPCTEYNPTGRTTPDGFTLNTLWGELAWLLATASVARSPSGDTEKDRARVREIIGEEIAAADAARVAPGETDLRALLESVGPSVILVDETLHYVLKAARLKGESSDLATQTVAFLRELSSVVDKLPRNVLVVSLTASDRDAPGPDAQHWLDRMEQQVTRLAQPCTPIEGTEIHAVVRSRLFDTVDEEIAKQVAADYQTLYKNLGGLSGEHTGKEYRELIERSYPFHPELVTVLYERWGAKPAFQLTRDTLRFLALALQDLWRREDKGGTDLIQMGHVSVADPNIRATVRTIAGDPKWEAVIGSDIAGAGGQHAKAELIDMERGDGQHLAQALATTILFYSIGGGENPEATRQEIRLSCARRGVEDATWGDVLEKFKRRLFYFYFDEAKYRFRKEPNVTSLHSAYREDLATKASEVDAYVRKVVLESALGAAGAHGFQQLFYVPDREVDRDDESLKLIVMGFDQTMQGDTLSDSAREKALSILEKHGTVNRQYRNTLVFCLPDDSAARQAREHAADFLSWRKIQTNAEDWERIGASQQAVVKEQIEDTKAAALKAIIRAYSWGLVPEEIQQGGVRRLTLTPVRLGTYGPGKLVAPMVWESLTQKSGGAQKLLAELTPQVLVERYKAAWPPGEKWISTADLWRRFTTQVGLPILTKPETLLRALSAGQHEGVFALGLLNDAAADRMARDSYTHLYFKDDPNPQVPLMGDRWLVLRTEVHNEVAEQPEQITPEVVLAAYQELSGDGAEVTIKAIHTYVSKDHGDNIDEASFKSAVRVLKETNQLSYKAETLSADGALDYELGKLAKPTTLIVELKGGRAITIEGTLEYQEFGSFYKSVLTPLKSSELTIEITVRAHYKEDPGSGIDATLEDAFDKGAFPGLKVQGTVRR